MYKENCTFNKSDYSYNDEPTQLVKKQPQNAFSELNNRLEKAVAEYTNLTYDLESLLKRIAGRGIQSNDCKAEKGNEVSSHLVTYSERLEKLEDNNQKLHDLISVLNEFA